MPRERRQINFRTFKLLAEDRRLLQNLQRGPGPVRHRYFALLDLIPLIDRLPTPPEKPKRDSIRIGIPDALQKAIERRAEVTKQSFVEILLEAARAYRAEHPYDPDAPRDPNTPLPTD